MVHDDTVLEGKSATPRGTSAHPAQDSRSVTLQMADALTEGEAAQELGLSLITLVGYRKGGVGPKFGTVARTIFYLRPDLVTWLESGGNRGRRVVPKKASKPKEIAARRRPRKAAPS